MYSTRLDFVFNSLLYNLFKVDLFEKYINNGRLIEMGFLRVLSIERTCVASPHT